MITTELPSELTAASTARAQLRECLERWGLQAVMDDAELVVSELVANAVKYGRSPICLCVSQHDAVLTVAVEDGATDRVPTPCQAEADAGGGRGLLMIQAVSTRWGFDVGPRCKSVWAEFAVTPEQSEPNEPPAGR